MNNGLLLWVDDEIDLLKSHILFLERKGYEIITANNGTDAIEKCGQQTFDLIMLDEMMPGISGLETLQKIKDISPATPVVMVTKSEEENIMEQAIGQKIADYLIKPVNPNQILLTLKKNIHRKEIVTEVTQSSYQRNFQDITMKISNCKTYKDWIEVYKCLVQWEIKLCNTDSNMTDMLKAQKEEANIGFSKYIKNNYLKWVSPRKDLSSRDNIHKLRTNLSIQTTNDNNEDIPMLSPNVFRNNILPLLNNGEKVFLIVLDNFRYDQWRVLSQEIGDLFDIDEELYFSILPTATQYSRNAIFSGLMPNKIAEMFPDLWVSEEENDGKNLNESSLIQTQLDRYRRHNTFSYHKINDSNDAEKFLHQIYCLEKNDLNVVVFNFIDMLSHARTESKMMRELANTESAYRSITLSWFKHSAMNELFKVLAKSNYKIVVTTDHGSILVNKPIKIIGEKDTNKNLRYKLGKNLSYDSKEVFTIHDPRKAQLPAPNLSTSYVFGLGDTFFAYPNNYNYYVSYYKDTFQHGGISMEEMIIPIITLTKRKRK